MLATTFVFLDTSLPSNTQAQNLYDHIYPDNGIEKNVKIKD